MKGIIKNHHLYYLILEACFIGILAVTSQRFEFAMPDTQTMILFILASFRIARTLSYNEIGEPLRALFTECRPDDCGAGMSIHPKGTGLQYAIGSLLSCPICTGTWAALVLFVLWNLLPSFSIALLWVLAIAGGSEIVHWYTENQEWAGRKERCESGKISPDHKTKYNDPYPY